MQQQQRKLEFVVNLHGVHIGNIRNVRELFIYVLFAIVLPLCIVYLLYNLANIIKRM